MSNQDSSRSQPVSALLGAECFLSKGEVHAVIAKLAGKPERGMLPHRSVAILYGNSRGRLGKPSMYAAALRRAHRALIRVSDGPKGQDGPSSSPGMTLEPSLSVTTPEAQP